MNSLQPSFQNVFAKYKTFSSLNESDPKFAGAQKALFTSISSLFPSIGLLPVPGLSTGAYFHAAQQLRQGKTFQDSPGSLNKLKPLAVNYCNTLNEIFSSSEPIKEKLERLGKVHLQFATNFFPEYKKVYRENTPAICTTYPHTLTLFLTVVFPDFEPLKSRIAEIDGTLLTCTLPNLAIEKLISTPSSSPELFKSCQAELSKMSQTWGDLSPSEKGKLHLKLLDPKMELQPAAEDLYKSIRRLSTSLHENQALRKETSLVFRVTFDELQKALKLPDILPREQVKTDLQAAKALILGCLSSSKDMPEALFEKYRQPILDMIENGSNDREIDRLSTSMAKEANIAPWLQFIKKLRS